MQSLGRNSNVLVRYVSVRRHGRVVARYELRNIAFQILEFPMDIRRSYEEGRPTFGDEIPDCPNELAGVRQIVAELRNHPDLLLATVDAIIHH